MQLLSGTSKPSPTAGEVGDLFVDTVAVKLYRKTDFSTWTLQMAADASAPYTPGNSADWPAEDQPATVQAALDQVAAAVALLSV